MPYDILCPFKKGDFMKTLTKDEYRELLNNVGTIAKFYIQKIDDIKYNDDFCETFNEVNKYKNVTVDDKDYYYLTPMRFIDRDNETICLKKNSKSICQDYEDTIIYYLTVDFNKRIKMYIDYNMIERNEQNRNEIYFEIIENYNRRECGDMYGNGRITSEEETGYKGCISTKDDECIMEYGKYEYDHVKVVLPEEIYESNTTIPEFKDMEKISMVYKMTKGVNNPAFLAYNEIQIAKAKGRQRIR